MTKRTEGTLALRPKQPVRSASTPSAELSPRNDQGSTSVVARQGDKHTDSLGEYLVPEKYFGGQPVFP